MSSTKPEPPTLSRRALLKGLGSVPLLLRAAPFYGLELTSVETPASQAEALPFSEHHLTPHYPARSPLEDLLRLVVPGSDEYVTEKYAHEIGLLLQQWGRALVASVHDTATLAAMLDASIEASSLVPSAESHVRSGNGIGVVKRHFSGSVTGRDALLKETDQWLSALAHMQTAEFEITGIEQISSDPLALRLDIRYDLVATRTDKQREERVGSWQTEWVRDPQSAWKARRWQANEETVSVAQQPVFVDITQHALGNTDSYKAQMLRGSDYWRTVLDGACGIDVYGNNGVAAGDYDNDGFDDLYICQPAGLPNRLYRNRGDGTFEDVTEKAGVGMLDNTACALFADFRNIGVQDLLVVCGSGPRLFLNQGDGTFKIKRDAFRFASPPQGTFTHAALADYDRDGRLDIYFCVYSYYLGLDQYHYPVPYFDARNGPPNFLFHNQGDGTFVDKTEAAGLNAENDRYSFACAWGESGTNGLPDLYVANDFGRNNLYRNNGDGTLTAISESAHIQDAGAGMSAAWADFNVDGKQDIYVANMWSAAGQRVAGQKIFHEASSTDIRALYQRHARGNTLYRNQGEGHFKNVTSEAGVEMGRWAWSSDFWDFDHDGYPDLYVTNGYISAGERGEAAHDHIDLGSFFWRQVVAKSPDDATPTLAYEHGWQALNELIRSDTSWSGFERNVMYANNRDGTFSEVSGAVGLDFPEDSRSFVLADLDHDGRLEIILKNRNAPQVRILHNDMQQIGDSIAFRLRGTKSNRDGIGAAITLEAGSLRQTKYLQAGSGFLAQHSKDVFFGTGKTEGSIRATIRWPSGTIQQLEKLPPNHRMEVVEDAAGFVAQPFAVASAADIRTSPTALIERLPEQFGTWLLEPLKAPGFALKDFAGTEYSLEQSHGKYALLTFWAIKAPASTSQLRLLQKHLGSSASNRIQVLAINTDEAADIPLARAFASQEQLSFPLLLATQEIAGIYNIIYRYLFDRRRDLPIPASFLLDREGMIVKVYQGPVDSNELLADVASIPATTAERMRKALPFPGDLYDSAFARNDFTYGVAMFQHGYLDQAEKSFQQVIAAKPDDAEGYYNLGTLHLRKNDFTQARRYLEQTLKLRPNYPEAWNNLGMMAAQQGDAIGAVSNFQQALALRPGYAIALLNLGNVYRRQGAFDKALESLNQALQLQPDDPETNYSLGMFYAQQNQLTQAAGFLQKAINLRPDYPEALNNLGVLFVRQQDYTQAEQEFRHCISVVPAFDQSYINLARLYALRNEKTKAKDALQQLLQLQPQNQNAAKAMKALESMP